MPRDVSNAAQLAKLLNLTVQQCYNLANSGTIPKAENGQWNLTQCAHAYIKYLQGRSGDEKRDFAAERARKTRLEADILEIDKAEREGRSIPTAQVEHTWVKLLTAFRARMLALPVKYAPLVISMGNFIEAERLLTNAVHEALTELADPAMAVSLVGGPDNRARGDSSAAEPDHQPVGG